MYSTMLSINHFSLTLVDFMTRISASKEIDGFIVTKFTDYILYTEVPMLNLWRSYSFLFPPKLER